VIDLVTVAVMSGLKSWCSNCVDVGWSDVLLQASHCCYASTTGSYVHISLWHSKCILNITASMH